MNFFTHIEKDDRQYLAIRTGMKSGAKGIQKLYQDGLPQGYIVLEDRVTVWQSNGWHTQDNAIFLYGDYMNGIELSEIWNKDPVQGIKIIRQLHTALCAARRTNIELPVLSYHSIYLLHNGGVLFVPRRVADTIHSYLSPEQALKDVEMLSHPECTLLEHQHGFTLLTLLYTIICGEQPFPATDSLERTSLLSHYSAIPPHFFQPQMATELSEKVATALSHPTDKMPTEGEMDSLLEKMETAVEQKKLQFPPNQTENLEKEREKRASRHRMRAGYESNKGRIFLIGAAAIVLAMLFSTRITSPDDSVDLTQLSAAETVELYYDSYNTRDHLLMDEITARGIASQEIREVMQMHLTSTVQMGYTYSAGIVTPQEYLDGVEPTEMQNIYGITDLKIDSVPENNNPDEEQQAFLVSFVHWTPLMYDDFESEMQLSDVQRMKRYDRTTVEMSSRNRWIITSVETESTESLEPIGIRD